MFIDLSMQKNSSNQHASPRDLRKDGLWATKLGFYLMWMEYLAISPSYELARRYRMGSLTKEEQQRLPADFDRVLSVYDDLGDVQRTDFRDWWRDRAMAVFGHEGVKPRVRRVDTLTAKRNKRAAERVQAFVDGEWIEQAQPNTALVSIPLGLTKTQITRQLNKILESYDERLRTPAKPYAKYPLLGTRQRKDTLFRYLSVVWMRSAMPRQALWRVGARAKVSDTYSPELDPKARVVRGEQIYDREVLSILTSRAYNRGIALAENAARGRFPSYDVPEHAVEPDLRELWALVGSRRKWKRAQSKQTAG